MSTETATITAASRDRIQKTGAEFIDVEVTYAMGDTTEVCKYAYPLETTAKEIQDDLKKKLATRQADREHAAAVANEAEQSAEVTKAQNKADKTVAALEGVKVK